MITGFYTGVLALFLALLVSRIIKRRLRYKVGIGDGGITDLAKAIRAHGNFIETVPMQLAILLVMELQNAPLWLLHVFGISIVVSRALHAYGITQTHLASKGRFCGTLFTLGLFILGGLYLIITSLI
jgi:hypothetical protein